MKYLEFLPSEIFKKKYLQSLIPLVARGGNHNIEYWLKRWWKND